MTEHDWPNVARGVHLPGGIRAVNNPGPEILVIPGPNQQPIKFLIPHYNVLLASLVAQKMMPIGVDFYQFPDQLKGFIPPDWRPVHMGYPKIYPTAEAEDLWSCLANAGREANNLEFADVSSRVTFEIRASSWRLRELSNAYQTELNPLCEQNKFSHGSRFKSLNSYFIYFSTHAFLIEVCTLRDYFAEFVSTFLLSQFTSNKIITMSVLRQKVLPKAKKDSRIASELLDITDRDSPNGWLAKLGAYRDLVVHCAPLNQATHIGFLVQRYLRMGDTCDIPSIYFPIPPNPFDVLSARSKGVLFTTVDKWIETSMKYDPEQVSAPDALDYCSEVLGKMMSLACLIRQESPIEPKRFTLTEKDIKGPIQIE